MHVNVFNAYAFVAQKPLRMSPECIGIGLIVRVKLVLPEGLMRIYLHIFNLISAALGYMLIYPVSRMTLKMLLLVSCAEAAAALVPAVLLSSTEQIG